MSSDVTVIVADDDLSIRMVIGEALKAEKWQVIEAADVPELERLVKEGVGDIVISDVLMPGGNGLDAMPDLIALRPELPFIVMSAHNTLSTAMAATERGAFDYLPKPFDLDELVSLVKRALKSKEMGPETIEDADGEANFLIGRSAKMQEVYRSMARVARTELTILILGESGTGKELVARAVHGYSSRKHNPFVPVNMAAIPRELIESELFGHEKGAFTGAATRTLGRFGQARGGTLFLDEIGDMPLEAQTRLLRVLQEGEYQTVGGQSNIKTDVRVVAATNKDLLSMVKSGDFREDLFFRLNVVPIALPPLRQRGEDVGELADYFLKKVSETGLPTKTLTASAKKLLFAYNWPGNVRELENVIQRLCALHTGNEISANMVSDEIDRSLTFPGQTGAVSLDGFDQTSLSGSVAAHLELYFSSHEERLPPSGLYHRVLKEIERPLIEKTLLATKGNQLKAADVLGLNRNTLRKKIQELDISVPSKGS